MRTESFDLQEGMTVYHYSGDRDNITPCLVQKGTNWKGDPEWKLIPQTEPKFGSYSATDSWWMVFYPTLEEAQAQREQDLVEWKAEIASREGLVQRLYSCWNGGYAGVEEIAEMKRRIKEEFGVEVQ